MLMGSHICHVDWHNNGGPCISSASCLCCCCLFFVVTWLQFGLLYTGFCTGQVITVSQKIIYFLCTFFIIIIHSFTIVLLYNLFVI